MRGWVGFWTRTQRYVLGRDHKLRVVPQKTYRVDRAAPALKDFSLYTSRDYRHVRARVRKGSQVRVLLCDCRGDWADWNYLVKTASGARGWVRHPNRVIELPSAG